MDNPIKISDLFDLFQGNSLELINMDIDRDSTINFVGRSSENNGVTARVRRLDNVQPFPVGGMTVALSGSVLSSFVQDKSFYTGFHVMVLYPKREMRLEEKLFYCHCIAMNAYRYSYGRQANKTLRDVRLPPLPDWLQDYTIDYSPITTNIQHRELPLDTTVWKWFSLSELFDIVASKDNNFADSEQGTVPYISSSQMNNGVTGFVNEKPSQPANTLTVARNGSVASTFYQPVEYCASPDDVRILYPTFHMNQYSGLFLAALIEKEKYRYDYGRKFGTKRMKETRIKLPVKPDGTPDWQFMENYIKSLPYSDNL